MECKSGETYAIMGMKLELIDTLWNVNDTIFINNGFYCPN